MPSQVTLLRVDTVSMVAEGLFSWGQSELFYVECNVTSFAYSVFANSDMSSPPNSKMAILGSTFTTPFVVSDNSHVMRLVKPQKMVLSNSTLTGGQSAGTIIKLVGGNGHTTVADDAQYIEISDNKFREQGGVSWAITISPVDASTDDRVENFILERNWYVTGGQSFELFYIAATKGTIRNNIFDMSAINPGADAHGIRVVRRGIEPPPADIHIYNNTFYSSGSSGVGLYGVELDAGTGMIVKNNLASFPNIATKNVLVDFATGTTKSNNTITNTPGWASPTPSNPIDFKPAGGSAAIGAGTVVPLWLDFFGVTEPSPRDLGAVNH
jgi:hypothetical protein